MAGALWVLTLLDNVTRPAGAIDRTLDRLENRISTVNREASRLGGRLSSLGSSYRAAALAGEASAGRMSQAWNSVHSSVRGAQQGMSSLLGTAAQVAGVTAAIGFGGKKVLDLAGMREMQLTQVETALGERDPIKVKAAVQWINKFADETPFTDQQTMTAVRQTLGWGFKWNEMQGITRILGDATTMNAADPADASYRLNRSIRAIGQIRSKGVLQAEEVNQLQENIPGISAILDREFGPKRKDMQRKGQITSSMAISAILKGLSQGNTAGGMERMSQTLFGLTSTLASRPQRIVGMLYDNGSLDPVKHFLRNLIGMTDFTKQPGKRAVDQLAQGGKRLLSAIFDPLNRATEGKQAERLVEQMVGQLDHLTQWFERNGPALRQEAAGFGSGLKAAADGAGLLLAPLQAMQGTLAWFDERRGGNGSAAGSGGLIGRILGFGVGAAVLYRIGNWLSFGMLGKLGGSAGKALIGGISRTWASSGWMRTMFMQSVRGAGWLRALGLANLGTTISRIGFSGLLSTGARAMPVVGWIITALTAIKGLGDAIYNRFDGFASLVDNLRGKMSWLFDKPQDQTTALGRALTWDPIKWAMGKPQAWEEGGQADTLGGNILNPGGWGGSAPLPKGPGTDRFFSDAQGSAGRLGVQSTDLLSLLNFKSGLDPKWRDKKTGEFGMLGLTDDLAKLAGTTAAQFGNMDRAHQLQVIEKVLGERGVTAGMNLPQILSALYTGDPKQENLWLQGTEMYKQNAQMDTDHNMVITAAEVAAAVQAKWNNSANARALEVHNHITLNGPVTSDGVTDIGNAAASGTATALGNYGLELGAGGFGL